MHCKDEPRFAGGMQTCVNCPAICWRDNLLLAPWSPHKDGRQIAGDINLDPGCVRQIAGDINKDPGPRAVAPGGRGIILSYLSRDIMNVVGGRRYGVDLVQDSSIC